MNEDEGAFQGWLSEEKPMGEDEIRRYFSEGWKAGYEEGLKANQKSNAPWAEVAGLLGVFALIAFFGWLAWG